MGNKKYDKFGYDDNGLHKHGYNKKGYDMYGYDKNGYNKKGYCRYDSDIFYDKRPIIIPNTHEIISEEQIIISNRSVDVDNIHLFSIDSFVASKGQVSAIYGTSGCGKTTFFNELYIEIKNNYSINTKYTQMQSFNDDEIVENMLKNTYLSNDIFNRLVEIIDIREESFKKEFKYLSGGQKQRLLVCKTILENNSWIMLDEPTSFQDKETSVKLLNTLKTIAQEYNIGVIIITHDHFIYNEIDSFYEYEPQKQKLVCKKHEELQKNLHETLNVKIENKNNPKGLVIAGIAILLVCGLLFLFSTFYYNETSRTYFHSSCEETSQTNLELWTCVSFETIEATTFNENKDVLLNKYESYQKFSIIMMYLGTIFIATYFLKNGKLGIGFSMLIFSLFTLFIWPLIHGIKILKSNQES